MNEPSRLAPGMALPPYAFVPGRWPHPFSDPAGHRFGHDLPAPLIPDPERWADSLHYLVGLDLFNHGYYWEAHEIWESLWHACGRRGPMATFFKALIQLAVAGVKVREQRPEAMLKHAKRAIELFGEIDADTWMGLSLNALVAHANDINNDPPTTRDLAAPVEIVFPFVLLPAT